MQKSRRLGPLVAVALACATVSSAQHYQADFPPEEFRARWSSILERIGNEAVAVVQGAPSPTGTRYPCSSTRSTTSAGSRPRLVSAAGRPDPVRHARPPPRNERLERSEGKVLSAEDGELARRLIGRGRGPLLTDDAGPTGHRDATVAIYAEYAPAEG